MKAVIGQSNSLFSMLPKETLLRNRFDFAIALVEFCKGKMAVNRSSNASELRLILSRLKEVQEKLERSDQSSLASKLSDINGSLSIIEVNQADLPDADCHTGWLQSYRRTY